MRIVGINIPDNKHLSYGLTAVYGVGLARAQSILKELGIDEYTKAPELTTEQENAIREKVESFTIEGDLKREIAANIRRLKDVGSYRGSRHAKRLPARGQRTKTNSRTLKGVKKTMGSGRRKLEKT
ncbi:30S ribosomal protein S13 [Candidatus Kaiserbacteria bacterium RIFCSPHIGHO2_02_FULL_50_50]|uniref:Small ribosomal subunit protein uS13 n=1 Tax=Candidatus Kaiserbacteria bacterium RIFCSPHIGHO2_02_FULL_50_50 TaxID=1798492 RepID=A0A1F6DG25_9BACT|nr:MAG: 30S ribosomal protein S13 [Candidatus Kaiserbacteria bacterium RIFCSPHIGHO2_02_FULL_50_50]OGG88880.1 MAG: 30S ribosomal protein S13 [Candidatus Kaiserbacteria bacterium RIFCSPLOWO2_12_FULL_50_10]